MSTTADADEAATAARRSLDEAEAAPSPPETPAGPQEPGDGRGDPSERPTEADRGRNRGLYVKLAEIMGELSAIPADRLRKVTVETRTGGSYSYDYITEATLMEELRPRLAARGIAVLYSDEVKRTPEAGADDNLTIVRVHLTFVDGETGEKWTCNSDGYGTDTGDKGANKAKTSALRYLLWKTFLFASPDDPETENVARRSGGSGAAAGGGGRSTGGKPISEKQAGMIAVKLTALDERGVQDFDGRRPQSAVHVRTPTPDLNSATASKLIDLLVEVEGADLDGLPGRFSAALDALLGPPRDETGDFPPEAEGDPGSYA